MHSWPLFDLALRTPRLVLRLGTDAELDVLARAAVGQVVPAEQMDFMSTGWTQLPSPEFERSFMQFHWGIRAAWKPASWHLDLVAFHDGEPIGAFGLLGEELAQHRTVGTGSWLLPQWRRRGLGREGRSALLQLAFAELGADVATSSAHEDNAASLGVSDALGYERTGVERRPGPSGRKAPLIQVRLTREAWQRKERLPVEVDGIDACREMFGVA